MKMGVEMGNVRARRGQNEACHCVPRGRPAPYGAAKGPPLLCVM